MLINSLQNVQDYLNGAFDTQLFRSLCLDITRFLPSRYVPDNRTMQANRDRFERKRLLQVCRELYYDSPLLSVPKTDQKRKASPTTTKDWSDKKRVKSTKKTSPASTSTTTVPVHSQCTRPGCVSRGTSVTHPHAQCFYKYKDKGVSPTTSLLAKKTKPPSRKKFAGSTSVKLANTSRPALKFIKSSQGSSSATPRKDPSEIKCWTCGQKGHYSSDCPSNTKSKWELRWPQM